MDELQQAKILAAQAAAKVKKLEQEMHNNKYVKCLDCVHYSKAGLHLRSIHCKKQKEVDNMHDGYGGNYTPVCKHDPDLKDMFER